MAARMKQTAHKSTGGRVSYFTRGTAHASNPAAHHAADAAAYTTHVYHAAYQPAESSNVRPRTLPRAAPEENEGTSRPLSAADIALQGSVTGSNSLSDISSPAGGEHWEDHINGLIDEIFKLRGGSVDIKKFEKVHKLLDRYLDDKLARRWFRMYLTFEEAVEKAAHKRARELNEHYIKMMQQEFRASLVEQSKHAYRWFV